MGEAEGAAHPFRRSVDLGYGGVDVTVRSGRKALVKSRPGLLVAGGAASFVGRMKRSADGAWGIDEFRAVAAGGRNLEAAVGADAFAAFRADVERAAAEHLAGNERMLVEADLVDVFRARKSQADQVAAIRGEIERRKSKIKALEKSFSKKIPRLDAREAALRAKLESLA